MAAYRELRFDWDKMKIPWWMEIVLWFVPFRHTQENGCWVSHKELFGKIYIFDISSPMFTE